MDVQPFFQELLRDVEMVQKALPPHLRQGRVHRSEGFAQRLESLRRHLMVLQGEAALPRHQRHGSVILSSWQQVRKAGMELELFDQFQGDMALRQALIEFLNSARPK